MKPIFTYLFLAVLIFSFQNNGVETITLDEALERKIVKISARGNGNFSGGSVDLELESTFFGVYNIKIEAGQVFRAVDPTIQDQLIPDEIVFEVKGRTTKTYTINGFCCEHENSAPDETTVFNYMKMDRPELLKLCELTNKKNFDNGTLQSAVWAVSDNYDVSTIHNTDDPRVATLRKNICTLTNQHDTWYNKQESYRIEPDRSIVSEPEIIEAGAGGISVSLDAGERSFSYKIYNANNELKSNKIMNMTVPSSGTYKFKFSLEVAGWTNGIYKVDMFVDSDKIYDYEFEV